MPIERINAIRDAIDRHASDQYMMLELKSQFYSCNPSLYDQDDSRADEWIHFCVREVDQLAERMAALRVELLSLKEPESIEKLYDFLDKHGAQWVEPPLEGY